MGRMAMLISEVPRKKREEVLKALPEAAQAIDRAIAQVLGVQGSSGQHARPGEPPRRQSGRLLLETRAIVNPSNLSITITTNRYGTTLNRRFPWLKPVLAIALPTFRKLIARR